MSRSLNIIFAGTPDFAAKHLLALLQSHHNVVAVYCPPDKPAGRGKKLTACATKILALEHGIIVEQPLNFKNAIDQQQLASYHADVMVVVAYGLLLPKVILETPTLGCINVHGSLLPKWRGAAPIQRSLEAGDPETGITIMQMDEGLDTGAMILKSTCPITIEDTSASLYEKLAHLGPQALLNTLDEMADSTHQATPQNNEQATYANKLDKEEAELDWQLSADVLHRKIRAYNPWPIAQFTFSETKDDKLERHKIRVWQADVISYQGNESAGTIISADKHGIVIATGSTASANALRLTSLQLPGKKPLTAQELLNGRAQWFIKGNSINGVSCQ